MDELLKQFMYRNLVPSNRWYPLESVELFHNGSKVTRLEFFDDEMWVTANESTQAFPLSDQEYITIRYVQTHTLAGLRMSA